jgi:hypothetical protein
MIIDMESKLVHIDQNFILQNRLTNKIYTSS